MTCIVAIAEGGRVYMAGDSASSDGHTYSLTRAPKVFALGPFLIGYTTSFRMGQLLQYHLQVPPHPEGLSNYEYMVTRFLEACRKAFKDRGWMKSEHGVEELGNFLVGYRGELFQLQGDGAVLQNRDGFDAVGSGEDYARAVLAVSDHPDPRTRLILALETAARYVTTVRMPYEVLEGATEADVTLVVKKVPRGKTRTQEVSSA